MVKVHTNGSDLSQDESNPVMLEAFEWYLEADHLHWQRLRLALPALKSIGINQLWLPPGSKAKDAESNGYDIYDAYDLGEFDQKDTIPTKWGSMDDLLALARQSQTMEIGLIWDAIFNHRAFADSTEIVKVVEVNPKDRRVDITEPFDINAWTKFDFRGRKNKYSTFKYNKSHFNGTDWNQITEKRAIYRFVEEGKDWAPDVGTLQGNADYLMLENLDYSNEELVQETNEWGEWIVKSLGLKGFRMDAVQHYSWHMTDSWSKHLKSTCGESLFFVGEFWHGDVNVLTDWLDNINPDFCLYDVPLMYNMAKLSWHENSDLRDVFRHTLVEQRPKNSFTFITNHDTQPGQAMETIFDPKFKPHAHSLILLRRDGTPCVFFGDLYGLTKPDPQPASCSGKLPDLLLARKFYAHGEQSDYFKRHDCIGWVRHGTTRNPDGMAVVISWTQDTHKTTSNGEAASSPRIRMGVGRKHSGETWTDILGWEQTAVVIDHNGRGEFPCGLNSIACFVNKEARGRKRFPVHFDVNFKGLVESK